MKPVPISVSPDNAFYKRTPLQWADHLGLAHFICDIDDTKTPMTKAEFKRLYKEQL